MMIFTSISAWATITGSGTENDPYVINTEDDWNTAATTQQYYYTTEGDGFVYIKLAADLNFSGKTFNMYGTDSSGDAYARRIRFDGQNHTISGININKPTTYPAAPFGGLQTGGTISRLTIANSTIYAKERVAGILVTNNGTVSDCHVASTVTLKVGDTYCGGIAAINGNDASGTVTGCTVGAHFQFPGHQYNSVSLGGIVGSQKYTSTISGCLFYGTMEVYKDGTTTLFGCITENDNGTITGNCYRPVGTYHAFKSNDDTDGTVAVRAVSGLPVGATVSPTANYTYGGNSYYAQGTEMIVGTGDANKEFSAFTATGATASSLSAEKQTATLTIGTSDITIMATLLTIGGTCEYGGETGVTWRMSDANSDGTYETLSINYNGNTRIERYANGTAPWYADFHNTITSLVISDGISMIMSSDFYGLTGITEVTLPASVDYIAPSAFEGCTSLARVNIQKSDAVVTLFSTSAFNNCASGLVFVVATPDLALQYAAHKEWTSLAEKIRTEFGGQLFSATNEGGTPAYKIATADDLRHLAAAVNASANDASIGKTFRQTADINLTSGGNFTPIGADSHYFRGTYDGGNKAISGLTVNYGYSCAGLFGYVSNGTVKNVILVSPSVTSTSNSNQSKVGALAGYCDNTTIENCHAINPTVNATGTGTGTKYLGALIGEFINGKSATNCYYYSGNQINAIGDKGNSVTATNVSAAHLVNHGNGVTIQTTMADDLGFTYDSDNDGTPENYWRTSAELTLASNLGEAPEYYSLTYATTAGTINGSTLTVSADATVSAAILSDGQTHSITYMKADGTTDSHNAIALDETMTTLAANQWYFVGKDINYTGTVTLGEGEVTLILGDGKTMNVGTSESRVSGYGINSSSALTIYGQSLDPATAGHLNVYISSYYGIKTTLGYQQYGGNVTVNTTGTNCYGIRSSNTTKIYGGTLDINTANADGISANNDIYIYGGQVDVQAGGSGKYGLNSSNITLCYTNAGDYIHASSYSGTVKIANGKAMTDGTGVLYGTLNSDEITAIAGQTLRPCSAINAQTAEGVNGFWTTYYNGTENLQVDASTTVYKAAVNTTTNIVELTEITDRIITKGQGVVLQSTNNKIAMTPAATASADDYDDNDLLGVDETTLNPGNAYVLSYKDKHGLGFYRLDANVHLTAHKAYFTKGAAAQGFFGFDFEEEVPTAIHNSQFIMHNEEGVWYTLDGWKLNGVPTTKGIYIHNGRKEAIR